jgi:hypothetical protein
VSLCTLRYSIVAGKHPSYSSMILPARNLTFEDTGDGKTSMGFLWFESNLYSFFPIGLGELIAKLAYNILHLNFIVDTIKLVHGFINQQR